MNYIWYLAGVLYTALCAYITPNTAKSLENEPSYTTYVGSFFINIVYLPVAFLKTIINLFKFI